MQFENRKLALLQKQKENKGILPFVTQHHPAVPNLKQILMKEWYLIEQQPLLKEIYEDLPLICYTERAVNQRYTRESLIIKKVLKHALGSHAGLLLLYPI